MSQNRIEGLDLMRAIAIMFVLIGHNIIYVPIHIRNYISPFVPDGVSFFFVLSGYLIGKILWEELQGEPIKRVELIHFWKRRWFRTLPNYFATLIFIIIFSQIVGKKIPVSLFQYFVFSQNFLTPQTESFFPESWSLAVEEWFYILLPIFLLAFSFFKIKKIYVFILSFFIFLTISSIYRYYIFDSGYLTNFHAFDIWIRKTVLGRLDSIFFGVGCYLIVQVFKIMDINQYKSFIWAGVVIFIVNETLRYSLDSFLYMSIFYFPFESIAICLFIPFFINVKIRSPLLLRLSNLTSKYSYSLYLVNFSIVKLLILDSIVIANPFINRPVKFLLFIPLSYMLSFFSYYAIEQPFLKIRDRI